MPFYACTYFPTNDRHGMPGFINILENIQKIYNSEFEKVNSIAKNVTEHLQHDDNNTNGLINEGILHNAFEILKNNFDDENGGFGTFPKFPQAMIYEFLLQYYSKYEKY